MGQRGLSSQVHAKSSRYRWKAQTHRPRHSSVCQFKIFTVHAPRTSRARTPRTLTRPSNVRRERKEDKQHRHKMGGRPDDEWMKVTDSCFSNASNPSTLSPTLLSFLASGYPPSPPPSLPESNLQTMFRIFVHSSASSFPARTSRRSFASWWSSSPCRRCLP